MQEILDLRGLRCPLPVLKARKAVKAMAAGTEVSVLVTDPSAPEDFQDFCALMGHEWLGIEALDDYNRLTLRLKA